MRASRWGSSGLLLLGLAIPVLQAKEINRLRWLSGCWEMAQGDRRVVEQWTDNRGGMMLGTGRTFRANRVVEYEFTAITPDSDGKLEYQAYPSARPAANFALESLSETAVSFVSSRKDFPNKINYLKQGRDSVIATIEGPSGAGTRKVVFPYRRIVCDNADRER